MKVRPLVLTDPEPKAMIDPVDSSAILRGTDIFEALTGGFMPSAGLRPPTEQSILTHSAAYASISLIVGAIAALPFVVYSRSPDGELSELPLDDLWWKLNEEMTPRWSAAVGWEYLATSLLMHGDAFARIHRRAGAVVGLEPIHPYRVWVIPNDDGSRLVYVIEVDPLTPMPGAKESRIVLDQDDVLHVPGFGFNGYRGLSPLRFALRMVGAGALATQEYGARFFANAARPDYVLTTDGTLSPEKVDQIREQIDFRHRSAEHSHRPMVLSGGLKPVTLSLPLEDLQLLELRKFDVEEIARIYGVPPFMIGQTDKTTSWGSGVETMGTLFVRYTLSRYLNKFQVELNRKLIRNARKVIVPDTSELERADFKSLMDGLRTGRGRAGERPIMTTNEARKKLFLKRVPGGDTLENDPAAKPSGSAPAAADDDKEPDDANEQAPEPAAS
jgi:HK97 family phage portal protein